MQLDEKSQSFNQSPRSYLLTSNYCLEREFFVLLEEFSTMTQEKCCHVIVVNEIKKEYCDRIIDVISLYNFGNIQHFTIVQKSLRNI